VRNLHCLVPSLSYLQFFHPTTINMVVLLLFNEERGWSPGERLWVDCRAIVSSHG
jgi:hypothetical protein